MKPLPADIIVWLVDNRSGWTSKAVAIGQMILGKGSAVKQSSHWSLYLRPGKQVEQVWPHARVSDFYKGRKFEIWRRKGITPKQRKKIIAEALRRANEKEGYGLIYVLSFGVIKPAHQEVCCTMVQDCYLEAGMFVNGKIPDDIYLDRKMEMVCKNYK